MPILNAILTYRPVPSGPTNDQMTVNYTSIRIIKK